MYDYNARVYYVVDGDTIDVEIDLGFKLTIKQRIRLENIDTPERGHPDYIKAGNRLKELILNKDITLKTTKQSKWGCYLGEIFLDGVSINNQMLAEGLAKSYSGGTKESW